ncbi:hypothetical protein RCH17_001803 [Arthrobacter sp. MP_M7]|nr:hypothetical protein [Arthrobacter sp. MP_M4]MEC5202996.1 hypothetical protein [Arthrobacter sp. MP_M7]
MPAIPKLALMIVRVPVGAVTAPPARRPRVSH